MTVKEQAIKTISGLRKDVGGQTVNKRICFVAAIRKGLDELDSGKGIPVEEIEKELSTWISE